MFLEIGIECHRRCFAGTIADNQIGSFLVMELPKLFTQLIQDARTHHEFGGFLGEDDATDGVLAQHHAHRLGIVKYSLELTLEIGDGNAVMKHGKIMELHDNSIGNCTKNQEHATIPPYA